MQVKLFMVILRQYSKSPDRKMFAENRRMNWPAVVIVLTSEPESCVSVLMLELLVSFVWILESIRLWSWGLSISTALLF